MTPRQLIELNLLALCIWRESRGETDDVKHAVGCSIRTRVAKGGWWGDSYLTVITKPYQYSSFNAHDANAAKYPEATDPSWTASMTAATDVLGGSADTSEGADSYFDKSLDAAPPGWVHASGAQCTLILGRIRFWKTR